MVSLPPTTYFSQANTMPLAMPSISSLSSHKYNKQNDDQDTSTSSESSFYDHDISHAGCDRIHMLGNSSSNISLNCQRQHPFEKLSASSSQPQKTQCSSALIKSSSKRGLSSFCTEEEKRKQRKQRRVHFASSSSKTNPANSADEAAAAETVCLIPSCQDFSMQERSDLYYSREELSMMQFDAKSDVIALRRAPQAAQEIQQRTIDLVYKQSLKIAAALNSLAVTHRENGCNNNNDATADTTESYDDLSFDSDYDEDDDDNSICESDDESDYGNSLCDRPYSSSATSSPTSTIPTPPISVADLSLLLSEWCAHDDDGQGQHPCSSGSCPEGRGLERYVSQTHKEMRKQYATMARRIVVELSQHVRSGKASPADITAAYQQQSRPALVFARITGEADAISAAAFLFARN